MHCIHRMQHLLVHKLCEHFIVLFCQVDVDWGWKLMLSGVENLCWVGLKVDVHENIAKPCVQCILYNACRHLIVHKLCEHFIVLFRHVDVEWGWKLMYTKTLQTWAHLLNLLIQLVSWRTLLLLQTTLFQIRIFFSHFQDHLPFWVQWEYEFGSDRLRWHIFDGLHAGTYVFTIKAKRSVWLFTCIQQISHHSA